MILIKYKNIEMWGLLFSTLRRANFSRSYENFLRVMVIMVIMVIMMVNDGDHGGQ
jgi:hypothetical protein